jgi:hypothetical protein
MDYAFTDQMVRADREDLTEAALNYLMDYKGSFEPLLKARQAIDDGYELGVAHVRMILNCMRADTSVQIEYTVSQKSNVIQFPKRPVHTFVDDEGHKTVTQPREFRINGRIKRDHFTSLHQRAEIIHDIDHSSVRFTFKGAGTRSYSRSAGWQQLWYDRIEVEFRAQCSVKPSTNPLLLSSADMDNWILQRDKDMVEEFGVRRPCPRCDS